MKKYIAFSIRLLFYMILGPTCLIINEIIRHESIKHISIWYVGFLIIIGVIMSIPSSLYIMVFNKLNSTKAKAILIIGISIAYISSVLLFFAECAFYGYLSGGFKPPEQGINGYGLIVSVIFIFLVLPFIYGYILFIIEIIIISIKNRIKHKENKYGYK